MLKEKLRAVQETNEMLSTKEAFELAKEMMANIGSTDPVLRDELIYSMLSKWIVNRLFSAEHLKELLMISIDDTHLFYGLGDSDSDTVFTRSFSTLITAVILYRNNEDHFLSNKLLNRVKEAVLRYAKAERDVRGYIEGKGWAHSIAHLADCLDELVMNNGLDKMDLSKMLDIIQLKIMEPDCVFDSEEDERMVTPVCAIVERGIVPEVYINEWILRFKYFKKTDDHIKDYRIQVNSKHFLRSLYFRFRQKGTNDFQPAILEALDKLNLHYR
ncbi:uncharacterized protein DUF2785 [Scopulibacillus darangshiensis]|uniref:Uncharacterized protein DUF2785 n=1 Tax=Scopulibacillus darangshiensis TaxID=442528 RepID=A0A4R2NDA2_9BACL|nr:DUF2785 domain-containing protein [Scopulibacillus darangshiensis]TCP19157.1 uncharacterized protein DUF2785 [Scopulibacillus darangshiensis]